MFYFIYSINRLNHICICNKGHVCVPNQRVYTCLLVHTVSQRHTAAPVMSRAHVSLSDLINNNICKDARTYTYAVTQFLHDAAVAAAVHDHRALTMIALHEVSCILFWPLQSDFLIESPEMVYNGLFEWFDAESYTKNLNCLMGKAWLASLKLKLPLLSSTWAIKSIHVTENNHVCKVREKKTTCTLEPPLTWKPAWEFFIQSRGGATDPHSPWIHWQ